MAVKPKNAKREALKYINVLLASDLTDYDVLSNLFNLIRSFEKLDFNQSHFLNKVVKKHSGLNALKTGDIRFLELNKKSHLFDAWYDFDSYLIYLEWERDPEKRFYLPRRKIMKQIVDSMQDLEDDKLDLLSISLPPGVGKAQPIYSKILTPDGYVKMGDIDVGDKVFSSNGKVSNVVGVFPQGVKDIFRVTFDDDSYTDCCKEHLWTVQTVSDRGYLRKYGKYKDRTISLEEIMNTGLRKRKDKRLNFSVEYTKPVEFSKKDLKLHPYVMGALIGDGSLSNNFSFTNTDDDILEKVNRLLPKGDMLNISKNRISHRIIKKNHPIVKDELGRFCMEPTKTKKILIDYDLIGKRSWEKHIPRDYLFSSVEDRLELLRGLMDTDGTVASSGGTIEFATTSPQLKEDVIFLVNTLGGRVTYKEKMGAYTVDGVRKETHPYYNLTINFKRDIQPFYCSRKVNNYIVKRKTFKRFIKNIEYIGKEESKCILIDDPSHLYLTDNCIVTHNTTLGIFFLTWIMGKYPDSCNLASAHGDKLTRSFYDGALSVITDPEYLWGDVFPRCVLQGTNSKDETINLNKAKRFKTLTCRSIDGALTGATRCEKYLYADDLVSGIEEAMNIERLDVLWGKYTNDLKSRKKTGCKEIHIATRWSVHDVIGRLEILHKDNPRARFIAIPAINENGESNFNFDYGVGFDTEFFEEMRESLDDVSFKCLYMNEPIEREGLLFPHDELNYYNGTLPGIDPDRIIAFCDVAWGGGDFLSMPIGYLYGDELYVHDVVFSLGDKTMTRPLVIGKLLRHRPHYTRFEANNGGHEYADAVDKELRKLGLHINITSRMAPSKQSKLSRIIQVAPDIKKVYFRDTKNRDGPYREFMKNLTGYLVSGKSKHDDAPDSMAGLVNMTTKKYGFVGTMDRPI